jgi:hypothetical protein
MTSTGPARVKTGAFVLRFFSLVFARLWLASLAGLLPHFGDELWLF